LILQRLIEANAASLAMPRVKAFIIVTRATDAMNFRMYSSSFINTSCVNWTIQTGGLSRNIFPFALFTHGTIQAPIWASVAWITPTLGNIDSTKAQRA
jgi:hypothetical protein